MESAGASSLPSAGTSVEALGSPEASPSAGWLSAGASSAGTLLSAGSSAITLSGDSSGMDAPALGSAVGVKTSVFSGVWLVLVSLSSPPRTAAMRALASLTEFSSGFM